MFVDYEFYKNNFKVKLSAEEFDKFVNLSCMKITKETCSRVTDMTRLKGNLAKARQNLVYQIISDTQDYVPFQQGILSNSAHTENDDSEIVYNTPYARFLYMGKLMLDDRGSSWALKNTKKHVVNKNLKFSKEAHSKAGAKWYKRSKEDNLQNWVKIVKRSFK